MKEVTLKFLLNDYVKIIRRILHSPMIYCYNCIILFLFIRSGNLIVTTNVYIEK